MSDQKKQDETRAMVNRAWRLSAALADLTLYTGALAARAGEDARLMALSAAAETAERALTDALDEWTGPNGEDIEPENEEEEVEPDLSGNWVRELVEGDDAGQEDESFDPYAGGVIFERDASDW